MHARIRSWHCFAFLLLSLLALARPEVAQAAPQAIEVSGVIAVDTTWTLANSPYVVTSDVTVNPGVTLAIEPGVVVKFDSVSDEIEVNGTLKAQGTAQAPIVFTSIHDDVHGGDTNGNGNATAPAPANWVGLVFTESSQSSILEHTWIGYGGYGGIPHAYGNLILYTTDVTIRNNTIAYSGVSGVRVLKVDPGKPLLLENNTFLDNDDWPILADLVAQALPLRDVTLTGNTSTGSVNNGMGLRQTISGTLTSDTSFPFVVTQDVNVPADASLTFAPGVVVKFDSVSDEIEVDGTLIAQGTAQAPIVFTSIHDDAHGGDTNGNGNASAPAPANWVGLVFTESSQGSILEHTWIGYGGYGGIPHAYGNLILYTTDVAIRNNTIAYSGVSGIRVLDVDPDKPLLLENNTFMDNDDWPILADLIAQALPLRDVTLTGNTSSGSMYNGMGLRQTISGTLTSDTSFPFVVVEDVNVPADASLTFAPGVVVKFDSVSDEIEVDGTLIAQGTAQAPIVFTSLHDDAHGDDTNGNGNATAPAPANWVGLVFTESSQGSILEHTWIGYGGYGGIPHAYGNIVLYTTDVTIRNNTIAYSGISGIRVRKVDPDKPLLLENNTFMDNEDWPILADLVAQALPLRDVTLVGNTSSGSMYNGMGLKQTISGTLTSDTSFPFVVVEDVSVPVDASLTFAPGVVVKFESVSDEIEVNGTLIAQGTAQAPIVFTSLHDDAHGGDTNGNGNATAPAPANWVGLVFTESSQSSILEHTWIGYGGYGGIPYAYASVHIYSDDVAVRESEITRSGSHGISIADAAPVIERNLIISNTTGINTTDGATPQIQGNRLISNTTFAVFSDQGARPTLRGNAIYGNGVIADRYGVFNADPAILLDAISNWWGDVSGPHHPVKNPDGKGDAVNDFVDFSPWMLEATNTPPVVTLQAPAPGATGSELPVTFQMQVNDVNAGQELTLLLELWQNGERIHTFDQAMDVNGWDSRVYEDGDEARFDVPAGLANGDYMWRALASDGIDQGAFSAERTFTLNASTLAVAGITPGALVAEPGTAQTFAINGANFSAGAEVTLQHGTRTLAPDQVTVVSPQLISVTADLTDLAGMVTVVVQQGNEEKQADLAVAPYLPFMALEYYNGRQFTPGRAWRHEIEVENLGTAPGVAVIGVVPPVGVEVSQVQAAAWEGYLGVVPGSRAHILAVEVQPGESKRLLLDWLLPWEKVTAPNDAYEAGKVRIGDELRFPSTLLGSPTPAVWSTIQQIANDDGDGLEGLVAGAFTASGMATGGLTGHVLNLNQTQLNAYLRAVAHLNPWLADSLYAGYLDFLHEGFMDVTGTDHGGDVLPLDREDVAAQLAAVEATGFSSWVEWAVGDPWVFSKEFVSGLGDPQMWAQSGAFLVGEVEGFVEGVTLGLWKPNLGAKALAHVTGLPPSLQSGSRVLGNLLSMPVGDGILGKTLKTGGKALGWGARKLADGAKPLVQWVGKYTGRLRPTVGGTDEIYRFGFDWVRKDGVSANLIHWGANGFPNNTGAAHVALGSYGKIITLADGRKVIGAGPHLYPNKLFLPWRPEGAKDIFFADYKKIWQGAAAVARAGVAGLNAVYPDDPAVCNQGAVTLRASFDPNDITGFPMGSHLLPGARLRLQIRFENLAAANLAAEKATVTLPIPDELDLDQLNQGGSSHPDVLQVSVDQQSRVVTWLFQGINLPPNKTPPEGEGWLQLDLPLVEGLETGDAFTLQARIVFDENPPIDTNVLTYTIDEEPPTIADVHTVTSAGKATFTIDANDNAGGSGVSNIAAFASTDGDTWTPVGDAEIEEAAEAVTESIVFTPATPGAYQIRLIPADALGNTLLFEESVPFNITINNGSGQELHLPAIAAP